MTRIVHTADWHLGSRLIDCERQEEHCAFLDWFLIQLAELQPDLVIVAGDIFDSATPPQEALKLYYSFLSRLTKTTKSKTLILGGNHDSSATLHAPRDVLRSLNVHVIASPPENPADGLLEFEHAVVCAVPYLRQRDILIATPGQSADEVAAAIRTSVVQQYKTTYALAQTKAGKRQIIGTGHLTAIGSEASPSERTIHIGNLGAVDAHCFDGFAYTALGHIHRPQSVGGNDRIRYVGSPIPLSFAEVDLNKEIRVIDIDGDQLTQRSVSIPVFRPLLRLSTSAANLAADLTHHQGSTATAMHPWVELTVVDGRSHPDLARQVREAATNLRLRVLKVLTPAPVTAGDTVGDDAPTPSLNDLRPEEVFSERLRREPIDPLSAEGQELAQTFAELLSSMHEADIAVNTEAKA